MKGLASRPWNRPLLQAALVPLSGEWRPGGHLRCRAGCAAAALCQGGNVRDCEFTGALRLPASTLVPLNFSPIIVTSFSHYHPRIFSLRSSYMSHFSPRASCPHVPLTPAWAGVPPPGCLSSHVSSLLPCSKAGTGRHFPSLAWTSTRLGPAQCLSCWIIQEDKNGRREGMRGRKRCWGRS